MGGIDRLKARGVTPETPLILESSTKGLCSVDLPGPLKTCMGCSGSRIECCRFCQRRRGPRQPPYILFSEASSSGAGAALYSTAQAEAFAAVLDEVLSELLRRYSSNPLDAGSLPLLRPQAAEARGRGSSSASSSAE